MRSVLALGVALAFWACGCESVTPPTTLRVMTWNIRHGRGIDKKVDLERIAAVIRAQDVDIVALQEVDVGVRRTDRRNLPTELATLCDMRQVFGKNIDYQGGDYGNALLTRLPILHTGNHHYRMLRKGEQRGLLRVHLRLGKLDLRVWNTHIDYRPDDSERVSNVAEIQGMVTGLGNKPIVLCGDFNDTPGSRTHKAVVESFLDAWQVSPDQDKGFTYPSNGPRKRIDYVFVRRDSGLEILRTWIMETQASDHLPVIVELRVRTVPGTDRQR